MNRLCSILALLVVACSSEPTQVVVQVHVDEALFVDGIADVELRLEGHDGRSREIRRRVTPSQTPLCIAIDPQDGDASRTFSLEAYAYRQGGLVAHTEHDGRFVDGSLRMMPVHLRDGCSHEECGEGLTCGVSGCGAPETYPVGDFRDYAAGACGTPVEMQDPPARGCTPDPERLGERRICIGDSDCPCGAHCELGLCEADCTDDTECGAGLCDDFGRCRTAEDPSLVPLPADAYVGPAVEVSPRTLQVDPIDGTGRILLRAQGGTTTGLARVVAGDGIDIACEAGAWASDCELSMVSGDEVFVEVRYPEAPDGLAVSEVSVHTRGGASSLSVLRRPERAEVGPFEERPVSGLYEGTARVVAAGFDAAGAAPDVPLEFPVSLRVYGDPGAMVVALSNELGVFGRADEVVADVASEPVVDGRIQGQFRFPTTRFLEGAISVEDGFEVLAETRSGTLVLADDPRVLRLDFVQHFVGMGVGAEPELRWRLVLSRSAALPAGSMAPDVPADVALATEPDPAERTAWEQQLWDHLRTSPVAGDPAFTLYRYNGVGGNNEWGTPGDAESCLWDEPIDWRRAALGFPSALAVKGAVGSIDAVDHSVVHRGPLALFVGRAFGANTEADATDAVVTFADGVAQSRAMPCSGRFVIAGVERPYNLCDYLRRRTGCSIRTVAGNGTFTGVRVGDQIEDGSFRWGRECTLPGQGQGCAETAQCAHGGSGTRFVELGDSLGARTGEASCAAGGGQAGLPIDQRVDADEGLTPAEVLEACLADFATLDAGPGDAAWDADAVYGCLDPARLLTTAHFGLMAMQGNLAPSEADLREGALAHHVLARWLELHSLLANESRSAEELAIFEEHLGDRWADLERVAQGWDIVFHPRFAGSLASPEMGSLAAADYRAGIAGLEGASAHASLVDAAQGLIEGQMRLTNLLLEQASLAGEDPVGAVATTLPRALLAMAFVNGLRQNGLRSAFDESTAVQAGAALATTTRWVKRIRQGANPLGIDEEDLPLIFEAVDMIGERYFAASEHIANAVMGQASQELFALNRLVASTEDSLMEHGAREYRMPIVAERWEQTRTAYDERLFAYCGMPEGDARLSDEPSLDSDFSALACAVNLQSEQCAPELGQWFGSWGESDVLGKLCVAREVAQGQTAFADDAVASFFDA